MNKPRMIVDENVLTALDISEVEFRALPLMDFFRMAMNKGFDVNVSGKMTTDGAVGKLTVTLDTPRSGETR